MKRKSRLVQHARRELQLAGLFASDKYSGMLGPAVLKLVEVFAAQGHSGMSAHVTIDLFSRVASFKALTPITSRKSEWRKLARDEIGRDGVWQSLRQSSLFSENGGKTYYDVDDPKRKRHRAKKPGQRK